MRGDSVTVEEFKAAQTDVVRPLESFKESNEYLASQSAALAHYSEEEAKIEAEKGTSCGTSAGAKKGPRYALRMEDRDIFADLDKRITERRSEITALVDSAESLTAQSADQAIQHRPDLLRIIDKAKALQSDPLLAELKSVVQQRLLKGRGPIAIPMSMRFKGGPHTFTCPDATLDAHLNALIAAIDGVKPVPDVDFKDARNPQVGFALALKRLDTSLFGWKLLPPTHAELVTEREAALSSRAKSAEGLQGEDIAPLVVAIVIEAGLTLLFSIDGGTLPMHPGLKELEELVARKRKQVFDLVWTAFGGDKERGAARRAVSRFTKFEGSSALVIVPIYSERDDVQLLHHLMTVVTHVHLARRIYTGQSLAHLFTIGWTKALRANALGEGAVRVYRMSAVDYLALLLDAIGASSTPNAEDGGAPPSPSPVPTSPKLLPHGEAYWRKAA